MNGIRVFGLLAAVLLVVGIGKGAAWLHDREVPVGAIEAGAAPVLAAARPHPTVPTSPPTPPPPPASPATDPTAGEAVQEGDWFGQVQEGIRKAEYNITRQDKAVDGGPGGLHAANRANNLRAYFREDGVQIFERETSDPDWDVRWQFKAWGRKGAMRQVGRVEPKAEEHTNRLTYGHDGIEEWYVNDERGLEHGFTIAERPEGEGPLVIAGQFSGSTRNTLHPMEDSVVFSIGEKDEVLRYTGLLVADIRGTRLESRFKHDDIEYYIEVDDCDAKYPICIDPTFMPEPIGDWRIEGGSADAQWGSNVSRAGDLNGDGFSDIIVSGSGDLLTQYGGGNFIYYGSENGPVGMSPGGASAVVSGLSNLVGAGDVNGDGYDDVIGVSPNFTNGQENEGAVILLVGSPNGLVGTSILGATSIVETNKGAAGYGLTTAAAGDVNSDGYDDVIIGVPTYFQSSAMIVLGGPNGLEGESPDTVAVVLEEFSFPGSEYGAAVAGVGDVNGDGYDDVVVGAPGEGVVYLYYGNSASLDGYSSDWIYDDMQDIAPWDLGRSLAGVGDVNGDGYADTLIGAPMYEIVQVPPFDFVPRGAVFLLLGSENGWIDANSILIQPDQLDVGFGNSLAGAGDFNGDGLGDFIIGAGSYGSGEAPGGAAFIYTGVRDAAFQVDFSDYLLVVDTDAASARLGSSVSSAGDVNGDGFSDLLFGAPSFKHTFENEGASALVFGYLPDKLPMGDDPASAANIVTANYPSNVSPAGDLNGDGYDDVIIQIATDYSGGPVGAYVFHGSIDGIVDTEISAAATCLPEFGSFPIAPGGDVNGDGFSDLLVGYPGWTNGEANEGAVFLFLGSSSGLVGTSMADAALRIESNLAGAGMGIDVAGAGDVNGDGYADIVLSANSWSAGAESGPAIFLVHGAPLGAVGTTLSHAATTITLGQGTANSTAVAAAGDVNGDGYADIIVGASWWSSGETDEGAAFVYLGSPLGVMGEGASDAIAMVESNQIGARFGISVASAGDVNGDGYSDVAVGAQFFDSRFSNEGACFIFHGRADGVVGTDIESAVSILRADRASAQLGTAISSVGDVNADGYDDFIVGASLYDTIDVFEGMTMLFLGSVDGLVGSEPSTAAAFTTETQAQAHFGDSVAGVGDINGDGYADIVVSSPYYGWDDDPLTFGDGHGAVFLYYGQRHERLSVLLLEQLNGNPMSAAGSRALSGPLRFNALAHRSERSSAIQLEWEVAPYRSSFENAHKYYSTWADPGASGFSFNAPFSVSGDANGWLIRVRARYANLGKFDAVGDDLILKDGIHLSPNPPHSRWHYPQWATVGPSDFRTNEYLPPTDPGNVSVTETTLFTDEDIHCVVNAPSISPANPARPLEYEYTWTSADGMNKIVHINASGAGGFPTDTLLNSETSKHEVWTCTVRAFDGVSFSHLSDSDTTSEIRNTPPAVPTVAVPVVEGTSQNLAAQLSQVAFDPDFDPIQYDFDWYVKRENVPGFIQFRNGTLSPSISSQINNSDTQPGDQWYVVVTPHDGEEYGDPASTQSTPTTIVQGGVIESFLSLGLSPNALTLGQSVTASGNVFPTPAGSPNVTFESTSPGGAVSGVFPEGTVLSGGAYTRTFTPTEASAGRSPWSITAAWPGDDTYQSATSGAATFTVAKAQPALDLAVDPDTALLGLVNAPNFSVTATLSAPGFPESLGHLLEGRTINLSVVDGESESQGTVSAMTNAEGAALFHKADFDGAGITFNAPGVWRFKAAFAGDDNLLSTETADFDETDARLTIKRGAGYAIVVLGRLDANAEGHREHAITTDFIYRTLIARQFDAGDIYYLREYLPGQGEAQADDIEVFGAATEAKLAEALGAVQAKMLNSPAPLYIVLVDHGNPGVFYMDDGTTPGVQETLTPTGLDSRLDLLQSALAVNPEAAAQEIVVINGSCYAGSFIPAVSGANRVVITSTTADNISYRGVDRTPGDGENIRDGEFFLMELFRNLGEGETIRVAYEHAAAQTVSYTAPSGNSGGATGRTQEALLDDNGDGAGTHGALSSNPARDGGRASGLTLGLGTNTAGGISWFTATTSVVISDGKSLAQSLFAQPVGRPLGGHPDDRAWVEVKRPSSAQDELASAEHPDLQRAWSLAGPIDPVDPQGDGDGLLEWSAASLNAAVGFDAPGTYKAYYFLYDGQAGQVASYLVTNIYVAEPGNQAPLPVSPQHPPDGATIETAGSSVHFGWSATSDPEGDAFTYTLEVSPDANFPEGSTAIVADLQTRYVIYRRALREARGLPEPPDGLYYWRVYAVDEFGAVSAVESVRSFTLENVENAAFNGIISGAVTDARSGLPVPGAIVYLDNLEQDAGNEGDFQFLQLDSDQSYVLSASAPGYLPGAPVAIAVEAEEISPVMLSLDRVAQTVRALAEMLLDALAEADANSNGSLSLAEARAVLPGLGADEFDALDTDANGELGEADLSDFLAVADLTPPVITITNNTPQANTVECGGSFTDPGATAMDNEDGPVAVIPYGVVNSSAPGIYYIAYVAEDGAGNQATGVREVTVLDADCPEEVNPDTGAPVITVTDPEPITIDCGAAYTDPGATATDDTDLSVLVNTIGSVDTSLPGMQTIVYTATDAAGNHANPAFRTVTVRDNCPEETASDTTPPVISVSNNTDAANIVDCGSGAYADPGATAVDTVDGAVDVTPIGNVNTNVPGSYTLFYTAEDAAGNQALATRTVTVRNNCTGEPSGDVTPPEIVLRDNDSEHNAVDCGSGDYADPGANVTDDTDTEIAYTVLGAVNTAVAGPYTLYYYAQDSAGNPAPIVTRSVTVRDNCPEPDRAAPTITLTGAAEIALNCGEAFEDPGASATDERDGPVPFQRFGVVNADVPGEYVLIYTAQDAAANQAVPVERKVTVLDDCTGTPEDARPVIVLRDNTEAANTANCGIALYVDPGADVIHPTEALTAQVAGAVDTLRPGTYALVYTAEDSSGNVANPVIRLVTVGDNCPSEAELLVAFASELLGSFADADTDKDNALSLEEARTMMPSLTEAQFNAMDTDSDGFLSEAELELAAGGAGEGEGEGETPTPGGCPASGKSLVDGLRDAAGDVFLFGLALLSLLGWRGGARAN